MQTDRWIVIDVATAPMEGAADYLEPVAALVLERAAQDLFSGALRVDVGGVEGGDAGFEGGVHARDGGVLFHLPAVGDPVAVDQFGNDEA